MSNRNHQANPAPTRAVGVGTRIKGVFETAHGIGENIRGRTLGAIDDVTHTGSTESKSHHASLADRGRLEAETGMAHISGYADPNVYYRSELDRMSNPAARTIGNDHTTGTGPGRGYVRAEEEDYYGQHDRADGGVGRGRSGYGTDHGYGHRQAGVRGFEHQRLPPVDQNPGQVMGPVDDDKGGLSPNRNHQNTGSEQRTRRDFPPELPPRPQTQAADNDQHGQMYQ